MKTTIATIIGIVLLAMGALTLLYSCNSTNEYKVIASLMIDKTEVFLLAQPDADAIKQLLPADKDNWQGYRFRQQIISDVNDNPIYQEDLAPSCEYLSNIYDKTDEVQKFFLGIDTALQKTKSVSLGKTRSSIYAPMVKELNHLAESEAKHKVLVIYSDMMENSYLSNFYEKSIIKELQNTPEEIQQQFEKAVSIGDLKGIEIYIIYQASNNEESRVFTIVSKFYKKLLEDKGAKVSITANINL